MKLLIGIAVCLFTGHSHGLKVDGQCKDQPVQIVQQFDVSRYIGVWYEEARYDVIFELNMDCITANYTPIENSNEFRVINTHTILKENKTARGTALLWVVDPPKKEGKLMIKFPTGPGNDYLVIGTDYENYSVVWSCLDISDDSNIQFLWILSRTPELADEHMLKVEEIIENGKLDKSKLVKTIQNQCFWDK